MTMEQEAHFPETRDEPAARIAVELPYKQARAEVLAEFEKHYVAGILTKCQGNVSKAARTAGIDRVYLHRLIKKYGLTRRNGHQPLVAVTSASS